MRTWRDALWVRAGLLALLALVVLVGLIAVHLQFARRSPGGTDFLVYWVPAREFLLRGEDPYGEQVILEVQKAIYGRPAYAWEHQQYPVYPLHYIFIWAPFALIGDYPFARALWMVVCELALVTATLLWLRLIPWKPRLLALAALLLYTLLGYFSLRGLINGNFVVLQTALFMLGAYALVRGRDATAGVVLALTTVKPHVALLPLLWVLLWSASRRRWRVWLGFWGALVLLLGAVTWARPHWWLEDLRLILAYPGYNPPGSPQATLRLWLPGLGPLLALALTVMVWSVLLSEWMAGWRSSVSHFLWTFAFTLLASQWSGIQTDPGNLVLTLPALVLVWGYWCRRWAYGRVAYLLTWALAFFGNWAVFLATLRRVGGQPMQSPVMYFPLPILVFFMLYTVRGWATRVRLLSEQDTIPIA